MSIVVLLPACGDDDEPEGGSEQKEEQKEEQKDNHEWVDLGLSSGTLWATTNVGASKPEEYGDYFAWGETKPKTANYDWSTYKWCKGDEDQLTKYCTNSSFGYNGFVDNKTELDPEDDAATANWGPEWRMPSTVQIDELCRECDWQWTTRNGVNGYLVKSRRYNLSLFLPAAGLRWDDFFYEVGSYGNYWSRTLYGPLQNSVYIMYFYSDFVLFWNQRATRFLGLSVRPVRASKN